jgi:hypothetical protein
MSELEHDSLVSKIEQLEREQQVLALGKTCVNLGSRVFGLSVA